MNARCFIKLLDSRTFVWTTSQLLIGENYKTPQVTLCYVEKIQLFVDHMHPIYEHAIVAGVDVEICVYDL